MVDLNYFLTLLLMTLRIAACFSTVAVFFPTGTPARLKGTLALILGVAAVAGIDSSTVTNIDNNYLLVFFAISEIMTGVILGFIINLIFEVVKMAGSWMDIHAGFAMVSVLDPTTKTSSTLIGHFSHFIAMSFFFIIDGHHIVIKLLIESTKIVPIGKTIVYQENIMAVMQTIFSYFALGIKIAIPLVLILVITDLCLGLISRVVPTIPIMIFGMPIKNLLGLITYIILLPLMLKGVGIAIHNLPNIFESIAKLVPVASIALIFSGDDKTEEATPKKKADSRKKGQIARSKDIGLAITMVTCTILISALWDTLTNGFKESIIYFFQLPMLDNFSEGTLFNIVVTVVIRIALLLLPFAIPIMISGIVASLIQTGFLITGEPLKPSFGKLNPISGFKNMFSKRSFVDLIKNCIVITIVSFIAYKYMTDNYQSILGISNLYLPTLSYEVKNLVLGIFKKICIILVILAAMDYFMQVKMHDKELKMTKQEIKDEYKQSEGDQQIKGKIKQKQREMSQKRMMQSVADATVVITNPTHLAIALKYEENSKMSAPKVVAKGADYVAIKIKGLAKDNNVPIVENKQLARLMYEIVEVDEDIPQELYQGVAEILAVVMKLKK